MISDRDKGLINEVQTTVEKCRRRRMESVNRANRIKCEINLIGGAHSEMGPLASMMVSNGRVTETTVEVMRIGLHNGQEGV